MKCLIFYDCLTVQLGLSDYKCLYSVRSNRTYLDLKQPIKPYIRAVNNQSDRIALHLGPITITNHDHGHCYAHSFFFFLLYVNIYLRYFVRTCSYGVILVFSDVTK